MLEVSTPPLLPPLNLSVAFLLEIIKIFRYKNLKTNFFNNMDVI